jgi:hypothetical protein
MMMRNPDLPFSFGGGCAEKMPAALRCNPVLRLRLRSPMLRLSRGDRVRRRARIAFGSVCLLRDILAKYRRMVFVLC